MQGENPVPAAWIAARNERRNLPNRFINDVFVAMSQNAKEYRTVVVQSLVQSKCEK